MQTKYTTQDRGDKKDYQQYLEAMDAIAIEKVTSASVFFEPKQGNILVDVGMASGTSTTILAQLFPQLDIIGVDINPKMVDIANETYQLPNLSFREDDGEKLSTFKENTVSGFFNCSAIHHITSYNDYDNNRAINTLRRQVELLKDKGVLVIRDFVKVEEKEVILELSTVSKNTRPSDSDLFIQFAQTARSLAVERGFPIEELPSNKATTRRFQAHYTDVVEFIRRKDYYANWNIELQEEYGYFTQQEFEALFKELGLRIILSTPIYNQWIINNRYKNEFVIYDLNGQEIGFPPTNYLIAGEKVSGAKQLQLTRHLPKSNRPFLEYASFKNTKTDKIYDVVKRPNKVVDIIPYKLDDSGLKIVAKHGYPRPLANVNTSSPVIDGKNYSGYIPEGLALAETVDIASDIEKRFNIQASDYSTSSHSLQYYTSPGGINEKVTSMYVQLNKEVQLNTPLSEGYSGFKDSGYLHQYDAAQLLNTAQTGALVEARLEVNIYNLFFKLNIPIPKWLGAKIEIPNTSEIISSSLKELLLIQSSDYTASEVSSGFLKTSRAIFSEIGIDNSQAILEYTYLAKYSTNTLVVLPLFKQKKNVYLGLELRSLPVPQLFTDNSSILTVPAYRLNKEVADYYDLEQYITSLKIGNSRVLNFSKLGEKYFPSVGITSEQVYPYLVSLDQPTPTLRWVDIDDLYNNLEKIEDAHLLITLCRLKHSLS
ncbi:methyltransferase domain-containing protein [Myroides marinus]|uniref:class I SAM-dependent methyltransferase n=1 Tax=Myroides marinus TaxID=703342 RepID=UPI002574AFF7|nr:class I SAM-dependent methyltransferase [Myroides marinus]MDM1352352.1 methyltransferase domain-containing protein [Myroides marinus]MDM1359558.1 methyltransferase domain-containing protein [Myroides marinus]